MNRLLEQEANEKWIDRSGTDGVGLSLITVKEHCDLLSQIALEMWETQLDYIKFENLEFVVELFVERNRIAIFKANQIKERIKGHGLLINSSNYVSALEFDHDEFQHYFFGEYLSKIINETGNALRGGNSWYI